MEDLQGSEDGVSISISLSLSLTTAIAPVTDVTSGVHSGSPLAPSPREIDCSVIPAIGSGVAFFTARDVTPSSVTHRGGSCTEFARSPRIFVITKATF